MPIGGVTSNTRGSVKTGTFVFVAHANDPGDNVGDYLECNGQNVSRAVYASLFTKLGVTWGAGDGVSTFTMPDARRRSPVGMGGAGTGTLGNAVGNVGGAETHALSTAELAVHGHGQTGGISANHTHDMGGSYQDNAAGSGNTPVLTQSGSASTGTVSADHTHTVNNAGSGTAHNNIHPAYICGVWIKT